MYFFIRYILKFCVTRGVWVSLCAMSQVQLTYMLMQVKTNLLLHITVFCGAFIIYNFFYLSLIFRKWQLGSYGSQYQTRKFISSLSRTEKILIIFVALATAELILVVPYLDAKLLVLLLFLALVSIFYFIPFNKDGNLNLRSLNHAKALVISLVWIGSTCVAPMLYAKTKCCFECKTLLFARFIYVYILVTLFDVRDIDADRKKSLRTTAVLLGHRGSLLFCHILCLSYSLLVFLADINPTFKIALLLSALPLPVFIFLANTKKLPSSFRPLVDSFLLLQFFLMFFRYFYVR